MNEEAPESSFYTIEDDELLDKFSHRDIET